MRRSLVWLVTLTALTALVGCSSSPTVFTPAAFDASTVKPYAVYTIEGHAFLLAEVPEGLAPDGEPTVMDIGHNVDATLQPLAGNAASSAITVVGPKGVCVTKGTGYARIALIDRNTGSTVADTTGIALAACADAGTPALGFPGEHSTARWAWPEREKNTVVNSMEIRLHASEAGSLRRKLNQSAVFTDGNVTISAADEFELGATSEFDQDLCLNPSGALAWATIGDVEIAAFPRPVNIGVIYLSGQRWLVANEDLGEVISAYLLTGDSAARALDGILPVVYDLDCEDDVVQGPKTPPLKGVPLKGPYASLKDHCKDMGARLGTSLKCSKDGVSGVASIEGQAPFKTVQGVISRDDYGAFFHLAMETDAGWFVLEEGIAPAGGSGSITEQVTVESMKFQDVQTGGTPELLVRFDASETFTDMNEGVAEEITQTMTTSVLQVCGVGASGTPSCLRVPTGWHRYEIYAKSGGIFNDRSTQISVTFEGGEIVVDGPTDALSNEAARAVESLRGPHPMEFP